MKNDYYAKKKKYENERPGEAGVITKKIVYYEALSMEDPTAKDVWVIDSGCTMHITSRRDWFVDLQENGGPTILLGDDHIVHSQGA